MVTNSVLKKFFAIAVLLSGLHYQSAYSMSKTIDPETYQDFLSWFTNIIGKLPPKAAIDSSYSLYSSWKDYVNYEPYRMQIETEGKEYIDQIALELSKLCNNESINKYNLLKKLRAFKKSLKKYVGTQRYHHPMSDECSTDNYPDHKTIALYMRSNLARFINELEKKFLS